MNKKRRQKKGCYVDDVQERGLCSTYFTKLRAKFMHHAWPQILIPRYRSTISRRTGTTFAAPKLFESLFESVRTKLHLLHLYAPRPHSTISPRTEINTRRVIHFYVSHVSRYTIGICRPHDFANILKSHVCTWEYRWPKRQHMQRNTYEAPLMKRANTRVS